MKRIFFLLLMLVISEAAYACKFPVVSTADRIEHSSSIYSGRVSGIFVPAIEQDNEKEPYLSYSDKEYRVRAVESIKGKKQDSLTFTVKWCGGGHAKLGSQVVAFQHSSGSWFIESNQTTIEEVSCWYESTQP